MDMKARPGTAGEDRGHIADPLFIVALFVLSAVPYVTFVGFYSDDWSFLQRFADAGISSPRELISIGSSDPFKPRPGHGIYAAALFEAFGFNPLPYHLVNTVVLAASCGLLNAVLRTAGLDRATSFSVALIFALLPQLSTVRVWYASFQISLGLLLFLASCLCEIRAARGPGLGLRLKIASLIFLAASLSLYEIFAPLLIAVAIYAGWVRNRVRQPGARAGTAEAVILQAPNVVVVLLALVGKSIVSPRSPNPGGMADLARYNLGVFFRPDYDWRNDYGLNMLAALDVNFGMLVPRTIDSAIRATRGDVLPLVTSALIALCAFVYVRTIGASRLSAKNGLLAALIGTAVFWIGYSTFLISGQTAISPSGIGNRTAVAPALGVALVVAGLVHAMSAIPGETKRRIVVFSGLISIIAFFFSLRIADLASHWARAYRVQNEVLRSAREDLAAIPAGSVVILKGICPYVGPGITFETSWDTTGALSLALRKPVKGDVANSRTIVEERGISTSIYDQTKHYAYADFLFVYQPYLRRVVRVTNQRVAEREIGALAEQDNACPESFVAHGVPV